jgi:hypothetical protein
VGSFLDVGGSRGDRDRTCDLRTDSIRAFSITNDELRKRTLCQAEGPVSGAVSYILTTVVTRKFVVVSGQRQFIPCEFEVATVLAPSPYLDYDYFQTSKRSYTATCKSLRG